MEINQKTQEQRQFDDFLYFQENETLYRALFEIVPVGLGIADLHGNLLAFNDAMMKPGGYTREDIQ